MRNASRTVVKHTNRFVLLLLLLSAVLITGLRLILLTADDYLDDLEQLVGEEFGHPIHIERLRAGLDGFKLEAILEGVSLVDRETGFSQLYLREVHARIDLLDSLLEQRLQLGRIMLVGTRLQLLLRRDGSVALEGFEGGGPQRGDQEAVSALLFSEGELLLQDCEVFWRNQRIDAPPLRFSDVDVVLSSRKGKHRLKAEAQLESRRQGRVKLLAELAGNPTDPQGWQGNVYFQGDRLALETLLSARHPAGVTIGNGTLKTQLWSRWENGRLIRLQGQAELQDMALSAAGNGKIRHAYLKRLHSDINWQKIPEGWQLELSNLGLTRAGKEWPEGDIVFNAVTDNAELQQLHVSASYLRLDDLTPFVSLVTPPGSGVTSWLENVEPVGEIKGLAVDYWPAPDAAQRWQLAGRVEGFSSRPFDKIPGIAGLDMTVQARPGQGSVQLASDQFSLDFKTLFREPLMATQLSGRLDWRLQSGQELQLQSDEIVLANADLQTVSRIDLLIPLDEGAVTIDMQTDFKEGDASKTSRYLPTGIMHENLVAWLDRAIVGGRIPSGSMQLYGPLNKFPFTGHEGRFQVLFDTRDVELDYMPEWPKIDQLQARVHFLNDGLAIEVAEGRLLQSRITQTRVGIDRLSRGTPVLINGRVHGPSSDGMRILAETPLRAQFAPLVETLAIQGEAELELDLAIPLNNKHPFQMAGALAWQNATLSVPQWELELTDLKGVLQMTHEGASAKAVKASIQGAEATFDLHTERPEGELVTLVKGRLPISSDALIKRFPNSHLESLQGSSVCDVSLRIGGPSGEGPGFSFQVDSDLYGMTLLAPSPFGKAADERRQFRLTGDLPAQDQIRLHFSTEKLTQALLLLNSRTGQLLKGGLRQGGDKVELPQARVFRITGHLDQADVGQWHAWFMQQHGEGKESTALPVLIDLQVGELQWMNQQWQQVHLQANQQQDAMIFELSGETLAGTIRLHDKQQETKNRVNLEQLHLVVDFDTEVLDKPEPHPPELDENPHDVTAMRVYVKNLVINNKPLGQLSFALWPVSQGITLERLRLEGGDLDLVGSGAWLLKDGKHATSLDLTLNTENLGRLITDMGFRSNIDGAAVASEIHLNWPLPVTRFRASQLNGMVSVLANKGRFLEVDPGIGRLIGLLSITELSRRLTLDFSDLFLEGFTFNTATGTLNIKNGQATLDDVIIDGPAAKVEITGRSGLATRDYDQLITVTPTVSAGLPIAGAIVGGPVTGAVLLLAQRLVGSSMDKLIQSKYTLTGSWDAPQVTPVEQQPAVDQSGHDSILEME